MVAEEVASSLLADRPLGSVDFPAVDLTDAGVDGANLGTIAMDDEAPLVTGVASSYSGASAVRTQTRLLPSRSRSDAAARSVIARSPTTAPPFI